MRQALKGEDETKKQKGYSLNANWKQLCDEKTPETKREERDSAKRKR